MKALNMSPAKEKDKKKKGRSPTLKVKKGQKGLGRCSEVAEELLISQSENLFRQRDYRYGAKSRSLSKRNWGRQEIRGNI